MANANIIDRAIAAIAPGVAARRLKDRARYQALSGAYKGASRQRDALAGWRIARGAPDELLGRDLPTLRERAADLGRNNPLAAGAINTKVQGVIGTGLKLNANIDRDWLGLDDDTADAWEATAERLFNAWAGSKDCHSKRSLNFYEQQDICFRSVLNAGDHFIQLTAAQSTALPFRLALQHIAAARVSNPDDKPDTATLVQGVHKTAAGAPLAYSVLDTHPNALRLPQRGARRTWTRLPAFDPATNRPVTLHLYRAMADDQTRGVPDLAPVIEPLKQLDRYADAELDAAVKTAIWALIIQTESGMGLGAGGGSDQILDDRHAFYRNNKTNLEDGSAHYVDLFPNDTFHAFDPSRPNAAFEPFVGAVFKQIGAALELPQEVLLKHFQSSYSAARAALLQAWQFFQGRRVWCAANVCQPVYGAFTDEQVAVGRLAAPGYFADPLIRAAYLGSEWIGDAPGHIDETKAVTAAVERINGGLSTRKRETAALTGEDWDKVRRQQAKERRVLAEDGLAAGPAQDPAQTQPSADDLDADDRNALQEAANG